MNIYDKLKFFKEGEFSDPEKMNHDLLLRLDAFRVFTGGIIISSSTGGKHLDNSEHYKGNAVDCLFPHWGHGLFDLYLLAERFGFHGIGIYPQWKLSGVELGGLHLDVRELDEGEYRESRWIGVSTIDKSGNLGKQFYEGVSSINLKKYGII